MDCNSYHTCAYVFHASINGILWSEGEEMEAQRTTLGVEI